MGVKCSIVWFMIMMSIWRIGASWGYQVHQDFRRKLDDIAASVTIDCGTPEGFSLVEDETKLTYISDENYIKTGENRNISSEFMSEASQASLATVRSFPQGNKNCYKFNPPEGKDTVYFLRAMFMYGNYDELNKLPEFDLYLGVNLWETVKFNNASHVLIKEIIHTPVTNEIYVCLLNTGKGTPFISTLELRHFHDNIYSNSGALLLYKRLDFGSTTDRIIRYEDDRYDRIWLPYDAGFGFESINTTSTTDALEESDYRLPSAVMSTAIRPRNVNESLKLEFDSTGPDLRFYVYMHFAELEELGGEFREFNIELNGAQWEKSVVPEYLKSKTISTPESVRGGTKLSFLLYGTQNSTMPPILNAIEIYTVIDFLQQPTDQGDVAAIMDIKSSYSMDEIWQGDPCEPERYSWDGLNCSYNGYQSPNIVSLNLSSRGLTGRISSSIPNLKSLHTLDLSNNELIGNIPELLSQLRNLSVLYLQGNKLSGSIPAALADRRQKGSLDMRVEGNPDLCTSGPCGKKRIWVPVVAAVACVVVIVLVLLSFWVYRRKRGKKLVLKHNHENEGYLVTDNRPFTYDEIVSITNNFERVIGKGGFGTVYHGRLPDGTEVAVKMLSQSSNQGSKQFRTEAQLLMRVHHRNLVPFIGYCNEGLELGIVYEYMAGGNLQQYLSDETKEAMSWIDRLHWAVDAAQGLEYLHFGCKPPIIHRDVKTANILLNEKMQAKLADFGFSKDFPIENDDSHVSTTVVGTVGYLDPEYYTSNRLTEKSDVYSFGIVLLELITGRPALVRSQNNTHIVQWVRPILGKGDIRSLIDQRLEGSYDTNSIWKAVELAMVCVSPISNKRPNMSQVFTELKECLEMEISREQMTQSKVFRSMNSVSISQEELGPQPR